MLLKDCEGFAFVKADNRRWFLHGVAGLFFPLCLQFRLQT